MQFSIIIPTYNNLNYLKICLKSIRINSIFNHEIIVHVNEGSDGSLSYIKKKKLKYTYSKNNIGLCSSINKASVLSKKKFILYCHDDMYLCPKWDEILARELKFIKHDFFYLSGVMIQKKNGHIKYNFGNDYNDFNEKKFLAKYNKINCYDQQGSHFAPHLVSRRVWKKVGGFSKEFNPGAGSDPDFNMKLWKCGVRIFKGISKFKVYHFGSVTIRKKKNFIKNNGDKTFLKKWGISIDFFKKYYLRTNTEYNGPLKDPKKNFSYFLDLFLCKIKHTFYHI